jgi:hypothetical protein
VRIKPVFHEQAKSECDWLVIPFFSVRANKFAKWKTGLMYHVNLQVAASAVRAKRP